MSEVLQDRGVGEMQQKKSIDRHKGRRKGKHNIYSYHSLLVGVVRYLILLNIF